MLQAEAVKQQASLDRVLAHKQQILEKELPELCRSIASMHCWDVVKARLPCPDFTISRPSAADILLRKPAAQVKKPGTVRRLLLLSSARPARAWW